MRQNLSKESFCSQICFRDNFDSSPNVKFDVSMSNFFNTDKRWDPLTNVSAVSSHSLEISKEIHLKIIPKIQKSLQLFEGELRSFDKNNKVESYGPLAILSVCSQVHKREL